MITYQEAIKSRSVVDDFWNKVGTTPIGADNRLILISKCDIVLNLSSDPFNGTGEVTLEEAKRCAGNLKGILTGA